jgi:hypothetical protein
MTLTFSPQGGTVSGTFTHPYTVWLGDHYVQHVYEGTLTGTFAGFDTGEVSGTFGGMDPDTGQSFIGIWSGIIRADGYAEGEWYPGPEYPDELHLPAWSFTFPRYGSYGEVATSTPDAYIPNPNPNPNPNPADVEQVIQHLVDTATNPAAPIAGAVAGTLLAVLIAALRGAGTVPVQPPPVKLPPSDQDGLRHAPGWVKDGLRRPPEPPEKLVTPAEQDGLRQAPASVKDGLRSAPAPLTVDQILALPPNQVTFDQLTSLSDADYQRWETRTFVKNLPQISEYDGSLDIDPMNSKKSEFFLGIKHKSAALVDNKAVMLGENVKADIDFGTHEESFGFGYSGEDGLKAGGQFKMAAITEKVDGLLGNEDLGLTGNAEVDVAKAQLMAGYQKGSVGLAVGYSLIEGNVSTGVNVSGVNVEVHGGLRLGVEFGLIIGKEIEFDFGPLKVALSLGKAKTLSD